MNKKVINELYNAIKDNEPLSRSEPDRVDVNPSKLERLLKNKFGEEEMKKAFNDLFHKNVYGIIQSEESYIKGHKKKVYYFDLDKLKALL